MKYSTPTLDINLNAVKQNYLTIKKFCNKSEICGTVKASSYGLGGHNKIVTTLKTFPDRNIQSVQKLQNDTKLFPPIST